MKYSILGLMSGTSLDGLDIALCHFNNQGERWAYTIEQAETIPYSKTWKEALSSAELLNAFQIVELHKNYGHYLGKCVNSFLNKHCKTIDFIASHGHTIFHQPEKKITFQIGDGAAIAAVCMLPVVCDFRSLDVALGGQGAPLVPIGDELLFSDYTFCLNLGGFANVSYNNGASRVAFDICPVNIVINHYMRQTGFEFDNAGETARKGNINQALLNQLNTLSYYKLQAPKSLGKEWVIAKILPLIDSSNIDLSDKLRTFYEHIAIQISQAVSVFPNGTILITGGGAYNTFLLERIQTHCNSAPVVPDKLIIEFKEALIFAFLGLLRWEKQVNCLKEVTGANANNIGGCIYQPR
jgi:anhydro-N-acetylmuramic acid kinase